MLTTGRQQAEEGPPPVTLQSLLISVHTDDGWILDRWIHYRLVQATGQAGGWVCTSGGLPLGMSLMGRLWGNYCEWLIHISPGGEIGAS